LENEVNARTKSPAPAATPAPEDLMKLSNFLTRYPDLASNGGVRWHIFNRRSNGIERAGAVVKGVNGRWLVSPSRYRDWLTGCGK
jgi:hypothetical protein